MKTLNDYITQQLNGSTPLTKEIIENIEKPFFDNGLEEVPMREGDYCVYFLKTIERNKEYKLARVNPSDIDNFILSDDRNSNPLSVIPCVEVKDIL